MNPSALLPFSFAPHTEELPLVCVMGMGFVGVAMATVIATTEEKGLPLYRVVGLDLPHQQERLLKISQGHLPFVTEDPAFSSGLAKAVKETRNFCVSTDPSVLSQAQVVVLDINLDIQKGEEVQDYLLKDTPFLKAIDTLGTYLSPDALLLVETTVPPGFCRQVIAPALTRAFQARGLTETPLIAHAYERVMPGKDYLRSIREYYRTFSALSPAAEARIKPFLNSIIDTEKAPLYEAPSPEASELAKIMENAYRSVNIAFIYEWCLLAEKMQINLFDVVKSIRVRKTHQNIMNPGFGVGGYCLTKDALLAQWSADNLYQSDYGLPFSLQALRTNDRMPLHVTELIASKRSPEQLKTAHVFLMGVSYREDVGDTRFSPAEIFYRAFAPRVKAWSMHDPYVSVWEECPEVLWQDFEQTLPAADIVVLSTRHQAYLEQSPQKWLHLSRPGQLWVDANNILSDEAIVALLQKQVDVIGVGKGHIATLQQQLNAGDAL